MAGRPKSRVFVGSLLDHINLLESKLRENGKEAPAPRESSISQYQSSKAQHPIQHRQSPDKISRPAFLAAISHSRPYVQVLKPPGSTNVTGGRRPVENIQAHSPPIIETETNATSIPFKSGNPINMPGQTPQAPLMSVLEPLRDETPIPAGASDQTQLVLKRPDVVQTLSAKSTHLSYNRNNGQISWETPNMAFNRYADELRSHQKTSPEAWQVERRIRRIIDDLDSETHEHLMDCFWTSYNSVFNIVDEPVFYKHLGSNNLHYSCFLHICCLAMGFRFADMERPGVRSCSLGKGHSTFHEGAKYVFESELETPRGITTIQALLILSDLECAIGRDRLGWMYAGTPFHFLQVN
jgi:hypothetical protein